MRFIYDNLAVIYLAIVTSLMGWLYGGTRADVVQDVVPWLLLFLVEILIAFPQKQTGESTYDTRLRVASALHRDPLVWLVVGFLLLLSIPFVNNGLCVSCDWKLIAEGHPAEPPIPFLPFCVNRLQHLNVVLWFLTALLSAIAVRHCLTRSGKRRLLKFIVWNGFALAILGFVQIVSGAPGPLWTEMTNVASTSTFFSTFGYPNMAGDYFTTLFGLAIAIWRDDNNRAAEEAKTSFVKSRKSSTKIFWSRHLFLVPTTVFFFAAIATLSRAAILLISSLAVICFVHSLISITHRMRKRDRVRKGTFAVIAVSLVAFFAVISMPDDVQKEIDTLNTEAVLERVSGRGQYHTRVATAVWRDNLLFGCGGWGYKHFCIPKMTEEEIKRLQSVGGINVHNDYLQFLAEHGLIGTGLLAAIVIILLSPVFSAWCKLAKTAQFTDAKHAPPKPIQLFALPAPVFIIFLTQIATFIHGFGDCPLRSPAVLTLFFVTMAAMTGYLPKETTHASR